MAPPRMLTARTAAWKTLNQCSTFRHDTADVLGGFLSRTDRPAQATDIAFGVMRHRRTLDLALKKCAALDPARVKPAQWNLLRVGVYEFIYAPKTADYAIINESVELARRVGSKKSAGFINAVLRNVQRAIESRQTPLEGQPVRRIVPQSPESGCLFAIDLLADPDKDTAQYFSDAFSIPQILIAQWLDTFGAERTRTICLASNRNPSVIVQPNMLLTTAAELAEKLTEEGVFNESLSNQIRIRATGRINTGGAYLGGLYFIQDTTAANAVRILNPEPGWKVADMCAAPGGKCMAAAIAMQDQGVILASDTDSKRLSRVRENAKRMRLQSVEIVPANRLEQAVRKSKKLDAIILDVPCSNTGVLARRVEVRWRWKPETAQTLCRIQRGLLEKAAALARPGTKILYSTCSIQPEENTEQIRIFLKKHPNFTLIDEKLTLPTVKTADAFDQDGGYATVIQMR